MTFAEYQAEIRAVVEKYRASKAEQNAENLEYRRKIRAGYISRLELHRDQIAVWVAQHTSSGSYLLPEYEKLCNKISKLKQNPV